MHIDWLYPPGSDNNFCADMKRLSKDTKLFALFIPIFVEMFLFILAGMVDTLMLSSVSDDAVGAVGSANSYMNMFLILFTVVSSGLVAVMTQYIGASKKGVAYQARQIAIILNGGLGIILSLFLGFAAELIIDGLGIAANLRNDAITYLRIVGGGCLLNAIIPVFSCYLRAFDKTRYSLVSALSGNAVNLILNALFIFVWKQGVLGVAFATIIGRGVNLVMNIIFGWVLIHGSRYREHIKEKELVKQIIRIGLPAAVESAFYTVAMAVVTVFLNMMDENGFNTTAKTYASQVINFSFCAAGAFAQANVIVNGWNIGKGEIKECYRSTRKAALIGVGVSVTLELLFSVTSGWLLRVFTQNNELINAIRIVLYIDIALEVGRATNMVFGQALKAAGDASYPAGIAIVFNTICAVGGTYLFGIVFNLGVAGAYIGMALDECVRAVLMFIRYQSGKWEKKIVISNSQEQDPENLIDIS